MPKEMKEKEKEKGFYPISESSYNQLFRLYRALRNNTVDSWFWNEY